MNLLKKLAIPFAFLFSLAISNPIANASMVGPDGFPFTWGRIIQKESGHNRGRAHKRVKRKWCGIQQIGLGGLEDYCHLYNELLIKVKSGDNLLRISKMFEDERELTHRRPEITPEMIQEQNPFIESIHKIKPEQIITYRFKHNGYCVDKNNINASNYCQ